MNFQTILPQLKDLPYITKNNLKLFQDRSDDAFNANIRRWMKKGWLIKLKNGFYVTKEYIEKENDKEAYNEFIATQLIFPSYLTKEYILQKFNVPAEFTYGYTLVTTRKTNFVQNKLSYYSYSFIKKDLFCGYIKKKYKQNIFFIATKAKALFDFIYFKKRFLKEVNTKTIEGLRLDLDSFTDDDFIEFEKYLEIAGSPKMERIYRLLKED